MNGATTPRTGSARTSLLADLHSIVGREHADPPEELKIAQPYDPPFMIDGLMPEVIAFPGTYEEVAEVLRYASETGLAVIPFGRGRYEGAGNLPRRYDIALSTARLNRIVEYEPADLTVTCQAGIGLGDISQPMRESGQMTPFGSAVPGGPSIGKLLATNEFGNLQYGNPRDFTIGMRVVTADGRITRAGGKVVKNVAGYDLCKLYIGSRGTLAVIVEATLKIVPLPEASEEVRLESPSLEEACRFAHELQRRGVSLWDVIIGRRTFRTPEGSPIKVHIVTTDVRGTPAAVRRSLVEIHRLTQDSETRPASEGHAREDEIDDWIASTPSQGDLLSWGISVLPSLVPKLVYEIDRVSPDAFLTLRPLRGRVSAVLHTPEAERIVNKLQPACKTLGATMTVITAPPELKRRIDVFGEVPPKTLELMRRVKQQFDPKGILSPGRFVGRI